MSKKKIFFTYTLILTGLLAFLGIYIYEFLEHAEDNYTEIVTSFDMSSPKKLEELIEAKENFLIFFGSKDCDPCNEYAPILLEAAQKYSTPKKIKYFSIDKESFKEIAQNEYGVMSTPTTLIVQNGKIVDRIENALSLKELKPLLK